MLLYSRLYSKLTTLTVHLLNGDDDEPWLHIHFENPSTLQGLAGISRNAHTSLDPGLSLLGPVPTFSRFTLTGQYFPDAIVHADDSLIFRVELRLIPPRLPHAVI